MTSRIIPADKPEEKKWPRLMSTEDKTCIVLFDEPGHGYSVYRSDNVEPFEYLRLGISVNSKTSTAPSN